MKINEFIQNRLIGNQIKTEQVGKYGFDTDFWKNATETDILDLLKYFEISLKPISGTPIISKMLGYWVVNGTGDVNLSNQDLKSIPIMFGDVIKGDFDVSFNNLTSLMNCPSSCYNFNCSNNKIQKLLQGPQEFIGSLNFKFPKEDKPQIKTGIYNCSNNNLKSLFGMVERCMILICDGNPGKFKPEDVLTNFNKTVADGKEPVGNVVYKFIGQDGQFIMSDYYTGNNLKRFNKRYIEESEIRKSLYKERKHKKICEILNIEHIPIYKIRENELNSTMNDVFGVCREYNINTITKFQNAMSYNDVNIINKDKRKYFDKITESVNLGNVLYKNNKFTIGKVFNCQQDDLLYCKINENNNFYYWQI